MTEIIGANEPLFVQYSRELPEVLEARLEAAYAEKSALLDRQALLLDELNVVYDQKVNVDSEIGALNDALTQQRMNTKRLVLPK